MLGQLPALLSLSIAWLLALDCSATSIRFAAPANLTQAQKFLKADEEAQSDFVRRCEVVVTVSDDSFLPVKPLDRFCQTTDAAMECRLEVGQRLKDTHTRDGDMGKFCLAVYDWFQGKYGMKCPEQCRKLQCRSTCMWLDAKKVVVKEDAEIKSNMLEAENALKKIKAVSKQVAEKVVELRKHNFTIKMANTKHDRANKYLAEKKQELNATQVKKAKIDAAYAKLEKTIAATQENLIKRDDAIMKKQFGIDKAKLKVEAFDREATREQDRAKEDREEEASLKTEAAKLSNEISELNKQKAGLSKTLAADNKTAAAQQKVLDGKVAKLRAAFKPLLAYKADDFMAGAREKKVKANGADWEVEYQQVMDGTAYKKDDRVANFKELVINEFKRAKVAQRPLLAIQKKMKDVSDEISMVGLEVDRLDKDRKRAEKASASAKASAVDLEKKAKARMAASLAYKAGNVTKPLAQLKTAEAARAKEQKGLEKAKKTLKFMQGLQQEQNNKVNSAQSGVGMADMSSKTQADALKKAKAAEAATQKEKAALMKSEKDMKATLAKNEKALMARLKAYKIANKDLEKHKPEIVRLHNLKP